MIGVLRRSITAHWSPPTVRVSDLAEWLGVATVTARRDVEALAARGPAHLPLVRSSFDQSIFRS
ncbi:DeoR family transcriptional regulator [Streptomyces niveus]|uniref:DeoR family transcriptional regulator n=1 Tax=Streptomyces niveus TaxID=193462 RepID=UPI00367F5A59